MLTVLLLVVALGAPGGSDPQAQRKGARTATLAVVVSDPEGVMVSGVMVRVEGAATRASRTEGGRIVFEGLPAGAYRVRFERDGFETLERELTARAGAPTEVKVTLTPTAPPANEPPPPEPAPSAPPASHVEPVILDLPALIEKEFVGRGALKVTPIACSQGGTATLIQLREPIASHSHDDSDEFVYVIAGEGTASLDGRQERLRAGIFLLVPRGVPHTVAATGRNPLIVLSTRAGAACETLK